MTDEMADEIPAFDLYAELEVSERASVETIQAAYRSLQLRNHPDLVGAAGAQRSARLNVARDWLTDPARRSVYDASRTAERQAGAGTEDSPPGSRDAPTPTDMPRTPTDGNAAEPTPADEVFDTGLGGVAATGGAEDEAPDRGLGSLVIPLRVDLGRLARLWIVGLAFLGGIGATAGLGWAGILRLAVAVTVLLVLLAVTSRRPRTDPSAGLRTRAARTGWSLLGWLGLCGLALEGSAAVVGAIRLGSAFEPVTAPVVLATAVVSLSALRRRDGPVRATVDDFLAMTPAEFETAVGQVLGRHGYRLRRTGGPGDLVADLTGTDSRGRATVVQCKRYAPGHPVGSRDVQLLIAMGMRHHNAEQLVLVTTSDFTDPARDLADEHGVDLINGEELEDLTR